MIEARKSNVHGMGLFATQDIKADTDLGKCKGNWCQPGGIHVLWVSERENFLVTCDLKYINHGDNPNVAYFDDLTVGTLRDVKRDEELLHNYGDLQHIFDGHTKCSHCQRTVRVKDGRICFHVAQTWSNKACEAFRMPARWVVERPIMAMGKNTQGECMSCRWPFSEGENTDCPQCCLKTWHNQ